MSSQIFFIFLSTAKTHSSVRSRSLKKIPLDLKNYFGPNLIQASKDNNTKGSTEVGEKIRIAGSGKFYRPDL
jgi:hypothetical protein